MSNKSFKKIPFLHLTFSSGTGFQYYLTLPPYFSDAPELPKQIRWSLGFDEHLARELATRINLSFDEHAVSLSPIAVKRNPRQVVNVLKNIKHQIHGLLKKASRAWQGLPIPSQLAKSDLNRGYERLQQELSQRHVLYTSEQSLEIIFALKPSLALRQELKVNSTRFDWPLGTTDQAAATQAAV